MMPFDNRIDASDDVLMMLFANGDKRAAEVLVHRHTSRVLALAVRMLGDRAEAEDVAQEAMMRLWKIAPGWVQGKAMVSTWLYVVARNLCNDRLRKHWSKRKTVALDSVPEPADGSPCATDALMEQDRAEALKKALLVLPERQREAISLRFLHDLPNPQVADVMGISVAAVESLLSRGKRGLEDVLVLRKTELGLES